MQTQYIAKTDSFRSIEEWRIKASWNLHSGWKGGKQNCTVCKQSTLHKDPCKEEINHWKNGRNLSSFEYLYKWQWKKLEILIVQPKHREFWNIEEIQNLIVLSFELMRMYYKSACIPYISKMKLILHQDHLKFIIQFGAFSLNFALNSSWNWTQFMDQT